MTDPSSSDVPVLSAISNFEPLYVRTIHWKYVENDHLDRNRSVIHAWGRDRDNNVTLLRVRNFNLTLYLELPFCLDQGKVVKWDEQLVDKIYDTVCRLCDNQRKSHYRPLSAELVMKRPFYYYSMGRKMIEWKFPSLHSMYWGKRILEGGIQVDKLNIRGKVIGDDINPVLALTTEYKLKHAGWVGVNERIPIQGYAQISKDHIKEYIVEVNQLFPVPDDQCAEWAIYPTKLSWDIESYSPDHAKFPDATLIECKTTIISILFEVWDPTIREYRNHQHIVSLGYCDPSVPGPDVIIDTFHPNEKFAERAMNLKFGELINQYDPDILMGYNIYAFDYPYLNSRFGCLLDFDKNNQPLPLWPNVSRLKDYECKLIGETWHSKGYGINSNIMLDMEGRLSIDLMMFVKKEYKLPKYSLNYVSGHFLDDHKDDMSAAQMFSAFEGVCEMHRQLDRHIPIEKIPHQAEIRHRWGLVVKYAIQDAALVLRLYHHLELWNYLSETANITHINIIDTFTRGQQIRSFSLIYYYCFHHGYVLNKRDCPAETYKGGYVRDPVVGVHDRVIVLDFESLYPNVMRANNTCPTMLIRESDYHEIPIRL